MMSNGMSCVKYLLFSFNLLFVISGIAIVLVAGFALHDISFYELFFGGNIFYGCMLLVGVGGIVLIIAFFGCCGPLKENHCMVLTFSVLLFIIFAMEIGGGVTVYVLKDVVKDDINNQLNETLFQYYYKEDIRTSWDSLQTDFQCCGINGPDDWIKDGLKIPGSCCHNYGTNQTCMPYQKGCMESLEEFISHKAIVLAGVAIGITFVQLIGIILGCSLAESIRKGYQTI